MGMSCELNGIAPYRICEPLGDYLYMMAIFVTYLFSHRWFQIMIFYCKNFEDNSMLDSVSMKINDKTILNEKLEALTKNMIFAVYLNFLTFLCNCPIFIISSLYKNLDRKAKAFQIFFKKIVNMVATFSNGSFRYHLKTIQTYIMLIYININ